MSHVRSPASLAHLPYTRTSPLLTPAATEVSSLRDAHAAATETITAQTQLLGRLKEEVQRLQAAQLLYMDNVHQVRNDLFLYSLA